MDHEARVPAELQDLIIEELCGELEALKRCAMVCKSWLPRAQFLLFSRLRLDGPCTDQFHKHIEQFPHVCGYVRELTVTGSVSGPTLAILLRKLHSLERVDLPDNLWAQPSSYLDSPMWMGDILAALLSMQALRHLHCHAVFFDTLRCGRSDVEFLSSATGLRQLRSFDVGLTYAEGDVRLTSLLRRGVLNAHGSMAGNSSLLRRVGVALRYDDLRSTKWEQEFASVNLLLDPVGHRLEQLALTIYIYPGIEIEAVVNKIHIARCANLHAIELILSWDYAQHFTHNLMDDPRLRALRAATAVLSLVPRTAPVEHVSMVLEDDYTMQVHYGFIGGMRHAQALRALEDQLCDGLPNLKSLTLKGVDNHYTGFHDWVMGHLARLRAREGARIMYDVSGLMLLW